MQSPAMLLACSGCWLSQSPPITNPSWWYQVVSSVVASMPKKRFGL
jgi:hypothetical protein